mmetsp:Transcript_11891/g.37197  ORF Transcript_11891/g.37197 Transcript_11891/m.37197 type:complete len:135 (-) Transcript_11891:291-695(-)
MCPVSSAPVLADVSGRWVSGFPCGSTLQEAWLGVPCSEAMPCAWSLGVASGDRRTPADAAVAASGDRCRAPKQGDNAARQSWAGAYARSCCGVSDRADCDSNGPWDGRGDCGRRATCAWPAGHATAAGPGALWV